MPYGVVACPSCRRAKAFELGVETTQCVLCGRRLDVSALVVETAGTLEQAQTLVGAVNARLSGATDEERASMVHVEPEPSPPADAVAAVVRATRTLSGEQARADAAARALTRAVGTFTEAQWEAAVEAALGAGQAAKAPAHLKRMLSTHVVYEPRPGAYRAL